MRRPSPPRSAGSLETNMTPMIDVIFNLLIFFVCTASFRLPENLLPTNISTPGGVSSERPPDPQVADLEHVVLRVLAEQGQVSWRINDRPMASFDEVRVTLRTLATLSKELPVILDIDAEVPLGHVIDLYDVCRIAGFETIQFAAE